MLVRFGNVAQLVNSRWNGNAAENAFALNHNYCNKLEISFILSAAQHRLRSAACAVLFTSSPVSVDPKQKTDSERGYKALGVFFSDKYRSMIAYISPKIEGPWQQHCNCFRKIKICVRVHVSSHSDLNLIKNVGLSPATPIPNHRSDVLSIDAASNWQNPWSSELMWRPRENIQSRN